MTIDDFCSLSIEERVEMVLQTVSWKEPFWLERIKTAIEHYSPLAVYFSEQLIEQYWELIPYKP